MVVYIFEGLEFKSLRQVRDYLALNYTESEALKFFKPICGECVCRSEYKNGKLISDHYYLVYFCAKRLKFIIRVTY